MMVITIARTPSLNASSRLFVIVESPGRRLLNVPAAGSKFSTPEYKLARPAVPQRGDVLTHDSRAHGESGGDACTYGFHEKHDLMGVLDVVTSRPVVLIGASLGAAVALQTAAEDDRVAAVVSAEVFSDLATLVRERAPFFVTSGIIQRALALAEREAAFRVSDVSPVAAAARIRVPVLVIHGALDRDTSPEHSRRVFDALKGPKRFILVPDAAHNQTLSGTVWLVIAWADAWKSQLPRLGRPVREIHQWTGALL